MRADLTERALRGLYSAALYLLVPITVYHLIWRGFRHAEYFQRWNERYAAYRDAPHAGTVWVHAVSVGEVNAAAPLVDALLAQDATRRLLVTTITPTGSARALAGPAAAVGAAPSRALPPGDPAGDRRRLEGRHAQAHAHARR